MTAQTMQSRVRDSDGGPFLVALADFSLPLPNRRARYGWSTRCVHAAERDVGYLGSADPSGG
jgi:hypothetical protein